MFEDVFQCPKLIGSKASYAFARGAADVRILEKRIDLNQQELRRGRDAAELLGREIHVMAGDDPCDMRPVIASGNVLRALTGRSGDCTDVEPAKTKGLHLVDVRTVRRKAGFAYDGTGQCGMINLSTSIQNGNRLVGSAEAQAMHLIASDEWNGIY